ncbi:MAG TPA: hypothetical protein VNS22_13800 [Geminicoccus sp.]|uniref:hypothetical protein n=1 Tax=Geminicoccus sp. TaxID=2024832 RepID=UPI002CAA3B53|nr:hypothetical protein [Geminicoccus sp.]HWL69441.1 hypothetical protein [Geminicoccus sp.]
MLAIKLSTVMMATLPDTPSTSADKMQSKTIGLRVGITALLALGGFVFPLLFIPAAFFGWTIYDSLKNPPPPEAAVAAGPKLAAGMMAATAAPGQSQPPSPPSLGGVLAAVEKFTADVNANVTRAAVVQKAMSGVELSFHAERVAIDSSIEHASSALRVQARRAESKHFDEAYAELSKLFEEDDKEPFTMQIAPIQAPRRDPDPQIDEAVQRAHRTLMDERSKYFEAARLKLRADPRLAELVKARLHEIGCPECWQAIS